MMWIILFSPSIGVINKTLSSLFNGLVFNIYSMEGLTFAYGMAVFLLHSYQSSRPSSRWIQVLRRAPALWD
jgi:hypothetical protein